MDLTEKYRPATFEQCLGQEPIIKSLSALISNNQLPPCMLFAGPTGVGKTTLARICAQSIGCTKENTIERNGSDMTGVDSWREILDLLSYQPFGASKSRVVIIDECQKLSKSSWDILLKPMEEPHNAHWILCSSEPAKIPKAVLSRCTPPDGYQLKPVSAPLINSLLLKVTQEEKLETPTSISSFIALKCDGSPRRALKYLQAVSGLKSVAEAQEIIKSLAATDTASLELCRLIARKGDFFEALELIKSYEDEPESLRIHVVNYFSTVVIKSKDLDVTRYGLYVINAFQGPWNVTDKLAPALIALATVLLPD